MELKINYSKAREIAPEMTIGKENFVLLQHNPTTEQFGKYGYCCNIKDYHLQDKIEFWLKNGIVSYAARNASK